jgi:CheY-like chemotaxis protein
MSRPLYCPACGTDVPVVTIEQGTILQHACEQCGLAIKESEARPAASKPVEAAPVEDLSRELDALMGEGPPRFRRVLIAEDTALLRQMIADALVDARVAERVITAENGEEMVERIAAQWRAREPLDLAVVDLEMPTMSGYYAVLALRAFERGMGEKPLPVVFFTARQADDKLKSALQRCVPARYLNKGTDNASPARLAVRLLQVLKTFTPPG